MFILYIVYEQKKNVTETCIINFPLKLKLANFLSDKNPKVYIHSYNYFYQFIYDLKKKQHHFLKQIEKKKKEHIISHL